MARRLTSFSKLLITLLIIGALFFGIRYVLNNTQFGQDLVNQSGDKTEARTQDRPTDKPSSSSRSTNADEDEVLTVQLVTWGGYAPGLYFNEGSEPSKRSRYYIDYGLNVRFVRDDDLINAMNAWFAGEYDILVQTADAFPLYTAAEDINSNQPKAFMQVDWSRGGDAIISKRGINSINDLRGKRVAVATPAPAQTLLITALEAAGMKYSDVTVVETTDNIKAAELFKGNDIDAAVVWSPFDILTVAEVPGSKVLLTTKEQSHVIGDIMFASEDFIRNNRDKINAFYEGWMKGVAEVEANPGNREKAAKILGEFFELSTEDALGSMDVVKFASHGDNLDFFGFNRSYKGVKGEDLYAKMAKEFLALGAVPNEAPYWRSVINTGAIQSAQLSGPQYASEKSKVFSPPTQKEVAAAPISSKPVSINFATGQSALTENAKTIIDLQFAEVAKTFGNARIRIEGNTDNTGSRDLNMNLSRQRAQSVANYLQSQYGMDRNRFVIVGNGPDKPSPGCESNATEACRAKNRRTDFELIAG